LQCADVCDVMTREVVCTATNSNECVEELPPASTKPCNRGVTCKRWETGTWSMVSRLAYSAVLVSLRIKQYLW